MDVLTLVNDSGRAVCHVYISPVSSSEWGDDWLGPFEVMAPGTSRGLSVWAGAYDLPGEPTPDIDQAVIHACRHLDSLPPKGATPRSWGSVWGTSGYLFSRLTGLRHVH